VLHYKGITLTPGGFAAAETIYRTKATGGDIPTAFSSLPYEGADAYSLGEFYGSGRQSRISLDAEGKTSWGTMRGYYEADFLGTGITSNNNQSNSYVLRQRVVWASAETNSHWKFAGGQMWSLATEDKTGISNDSGDIMTPLTIDPNYVTGFVWTRQYGFRVVQDASRMWPSASRRKTRSCSIQLRWPATRPMRSWAARAERRQLQRGGQRQRSHNLHSELLQPEAD
jgi:hypothetical protein